MEKTKFAYSIVGNKVVEIIYAENLKDAKRIAKEKGYNLYFYKVCRNYERGQYASSGKTFLH